MTRFRIRKRKPASRQPAGATLLHKRRCGTPGMWIQARIPPKARALAGELAPSRVRQGGESRARNLWAPARHTHIRCCRSRAVLPPPGVPAGFVVLELRTCSTPTETCLLSKQSVQTGFLPHPRISFPAADTRARKDPHVQLKCPAFCARWHLATCEGGPWGA